MRFKLPGFRASHERHALLPNRRPLPGGVQDTQDAHQIAGPVIDQDVMPVRHQLAGARHPTSPAQTGMVEQQAGFL